MASILPHLPDIERLSPAVIRILGGNPGPFTLQGTNTYLVGTGPKRLLVDTGEGKPLWIENLKKVLAEEKASVVSAVITHWHPDHQGGVPDLLNSSPDTRVYKNQPTAGRIDITRGGTVPILDIIDGQVFTVEGASLRAIHTPGHAVDHMVLLLKPEDALFTADNVLGHGTAVFEDLKTYLESLSKMSTLFSGYKRTAYPGHGAVISDGPVKIAEYIQHRQEREDQIVQTLRGGDADARTPLDIVKAIYVNIPESLQQAAKGNVDQILQKLEGDGKAAVEEGRWRWTGHSTV